MSATTFVVLAILVGLLIASSVMLVVLEASKSGLRAKDALQRLWQLISGK